MRFAFFFLTTTSMATMACAQSETPPRDATNCEEPKTNAQVRVHLESDEAGAAIERRSIRDVAEWRTVCKAPCDLQLFTDDEYRIGGKGIVPSTPFRIEGDVDAADVKVDAARASTRTTGTILLGVGAGSAAVSTLAWSIYMSTHPDDEPAHRVTRALAISFAVDFLLLVPGIALSAASTSVEVSPRSSTSALTVVPGGFVF